MINSSLSAGLWHRKIQFPYVVLLLLSTIILSGFSLQLLKKDKPIAEQQRFTQSTNDNNSMVRLRMKNRYQFASPLLMVEGDKESSSLAQLKNEVATLIENKKTAGEITAASVYVRKLNTGDWTSINDNETYITGSLIKVPTLMTLLKKNESSPGFLSHEIFFKDSYQKYAPTQTFKGKEIEPGKNYKLNDLLFYMITKSDNNATMLLHNFFDIDEFKYLFTSIGLTEPDVHNPKYEMTASGFSKFMRLLYNGTYLSPADADYALNLLSQSDFREGMLKQLPAGLKVAHKFGEFGESERGTWKQLSESGIIFLNDNPLLVTIMTKGNDVHLLPQAISDISKYIYDYVSVKAGS